MVINKDNTTSTYGSCRYDFPNISVGSTVRNFNFFDYCQCSLDNGRSAIGQGVCALPGQAQYSAYTAAIVAMLQNGASNCHTLDRRNLVAQKDCGAGAESSTYQYWANAAQLEFNITNWAQVQDSDTANCLHQALATSYESMTMTWGMRGLISSLSIPLVTLLSTILL